MNIDSSQIVEQQTQSWNKYSSKWRKWDKIVLKHKHIYTEKIVELLHPNKSDIILDIASGTGEPALSIAEKVMEGKVIATDVSEEMLAVAVDKSKQRGISNLETIICEANKLPFENNTFDAVSCRFGFMFFPDMKKALKEMIRVLKPGGKIVAAVWNTPDKNIWVTIMMDALKKYVEIPPPPPQDQPGMFRCSGKNYMKNLFEGEGLKNVNEIEVNGKDDFDNAIDYWDITTDMSVNVATILEKADESTKQKIKEELINMLNEKFRGRKIELPSNAAITAGEKRK